MSMTVEEKVQSIETITTLMTDQSGSAVWSVEGKQLFLRVTAGEQKWSICANAEPRADAEKMCADHLLMKLANVAALCPKCHTHVERKRRDPETNKLAVKRYRCPSCLYSWIDS